MEETAQVLFFVGGTLTVSFVLKYFISDRFKIPAVTLYILLGVATGISFVRIYDIELLDHLSFISKMALGLIAFIIGSELDKNVIVSLGKSILFIAFFEAILAFFAVTVAVYYFTSLPFYYAIIMGAVASATAPAATVHVIRQYKSRGPLTSTIMGVVGIDDAISLVIFVFASVFASTLMTGQNDVSLLMIFLKPVVSILISLGIGSAAGILYTLILKKIWDNEIVLMAIFSFILMLLGLSELLHISELLTVMAFGAFLANTDSFMVGRAKKNIEVLSPLLLPLFFIFAGSRLDIRLIGQIGLVGLLYTAARMAGKIGGASLGAALGKAQPMVKKWIGFSLIPQVGVAVALALAVNNQFGKGAYGPEGIKLANIVINLLLFTTIITEVVGPILTRYALFKAKEIPDE